ncbi:LexA family transcriptional regulator [Acidovorax sp. M14]|uniref:LexA family transcriptional regulator n=1 Tax=Acidovorax sp. M14 TaxID=3411354 RepID=UPI003BF55D7B
MTLQNRLAEVFPEPQERGLRTEIARLCGVSGASVSNWFGNPEKVATISRENAEKLIARYGLAVTPAWLAEGKLPKFSNGEVGHLPSRAPAPHEAPSDAPGAPPDLVITEFDTGGGMDTTGRLLLDDQPGTIKSWRVTHEWLRLNVPNHTGIRNLCIVTGFGPSMRPMFNPGDPLLVDTGVKTVTHEGVYFFRVGDEGYIKMIQRVPDPHGDGVMLNIISKNPDYPPYPMSPKNPHFEVLGKVLTVWRSEQY